MINIQSIKIIIEYLFIFFLILGGIGIINILINLYIAYRCQIKVERKLKEIEDILDKNIKTLNQFFIKLDSIDLNTNDISYIISINSRVINQYKNKIEKMRDNLMNLSESEISKLIDDMEKLQSTMKLVIKNIEVISEALEGDKWII